MTTRFSMRVRLSWLLCIMVAVYCTPVQAIDRLQVGEYFRETLVGGPELNFRVSEITPDGKYYCEIAPNNPNDLSDGYDFDTLKCTRNKEYIVRGLYYLRGVGANAFSGCTNLKKVTLPMNILYVGDGAFQGCTGLTVVNLPGRLQRIGNEAFAGCTALTGLAVPLTTRSIGDEAFRNTGMQELSLPIGLESIGEAAFAYNPNLKQVFVEKPQTTIPDGYKSQAIFSNINSEAKLIVPPGAINSYGPEWRSYFKTVEESPLPAMSMSYSADRLYDGKITDQVNGQKQKVRIKSKIHEDVSVRVVNALGKSKIIVIPADEVVQTTEQDPVNKTLEKELRFDDDYDNDVMNVSIYGPAQHVIMKWNNIENIVGAPNNQIDTLRNFLANINYEGVEFTLPGFDRLTYLDLWNYDNSNLKLVNLSQNQNLKTVFFSSSYGAMGACEWNYLYMHLPDKNNAAERPMVQVPELTNYPKYNYSDPIIAQSLGWDVVKYRGSVAWRDFRLTGPVEKETSWMNCTSGLYIDYAPEIMDVSYYDGNGILRPLIPNVSKIRTSTKIVVTPHKKGQLLTNLTLNNNAVSLDDQYSFVPGIGGLLRAEVVTTLNEVRMNPEVVAGHQPTLVAGNIVPKRILNIGGDYTLAVREVPQMPDSLKVAPDAGSIDFMGKYQHPVDTYYQANWSWIANTDDVGTDAMYTKQELEDMLHKKMDRNLGLKVKIAHHESLLRNAWMNNVGFHFIQGQTPSAGEIDEIPLNFYTYQALVTEGNYARGSNNATYFFVRPSNNEVCRIAARWNKADNRFENPTPMQVLFGTGYRVGINWEANADGNVSANLVDGQDYEFHAHISYAEVTRPLAPRRIYGIDNSGTGWTTVIRPLDLTPASIMTGINDVVSDASSAIVATEYVDASGRVSDKPFNGLNIIRHHHANGSVTTSKQIIR